MSEREPAVLGGEPGGRARPADGERPGARGVSRPAGEHASPVGQTRAAAPAVEPRPRPVSARPGPGGARPAPRSSRPPPTFHVAGFWRRVAAAALDAAVLVPACLILTWLAGALSGVHLPASRHGGLDFWLDLLLGSDPALVGGLGLSLAIASIYVLLFQFTTGRTLGMRALKLRIIDIYGDAPSFGRAAARTAGYLVGLATLGLGFLWVGFDSERRGLHDWLSGTYVVKASS